MKKIKLTRGKYAIVDDEDYHYLNRFQWSASKKVNDYYAVMTKTKRKLGRASGFYMHEFIINLDSYDCVTFKNKNTLDYRKENIFGVNIGTKQARARKMQGAKYTSKYKGVSFREKNKIYEVRITKNKKTYHLGCYRNERIAASVYNAKARELYGDFAYQNKI